MREVGVSTAFNSWRCRDLRRRCRAWALRIGGSPLTHLGRASHLPIEALRASILLRICGTSPWSVARVWSRGGPPPRGFSKAARQIGERGLSIATSTRSIVPGVHGTCRWRCRGHRTQGGAAGSPSGTSGMWIIGGGDAKERNFECTRGADASRIAPTRSPCRCRRHE